MTWLFQNEYIPRIRIPKVKEEIKVQPQYTEDEIKRFIAYRPKYASMQRLHAIICLIVDCGFRIDEVLSIKGCDVDFQNLLIKVMGKGNKERIVPMSPELRKILFRIKPTENNPFGLFFPTRSGVKVNYNNLLKDMKRYCRATKVPYKAFHGLRRAFATSFMRNGGDVFALQRMLGHSDISTTRIYVNLDMEDIRRSQLKTSLLSKLR
jgi:integrase/recombinase XerD